MNYIRLPLNAKDEKKRYSLADPDALAKLVNFARHAHYEGSRLSGTEISALLTIAQSYLHLTTYELGQEHCVRQLRDLWRARRAFAEAKRASSPSSELGLFWPGLEKLPTNDYST